MTHRILAAAALLAALGGCNRFDDAEQPANNTQAAKAEPKKNINQPVEEAMTAIPPQMRVEYQKAFACEVKRNNAAKGKAIEVTAQYVRDLTARLKANPSISTC